jgi:hypothetical protein
MMMLWLSVLVASDNLVVVTVALAWVFIYAIGAAYAKHKESKQ